MDGTMTDTTTTLTKSFVLPLPAAQAWDWLTKADKLAEWFNPHDGDLALGKPYAHIGQDGAKMCWGEVLAFEPPKRLRQSFTVRPLGGVMTEVEWVLTDIPGGTLIELTHSGIPAGEGGELGVLAHLDAGWDKHIGSLRGSV